jgi:hypothetical protein
MLPDEMNARVGYMGCPHTRAGQREGLVMMSTLSVEAIAL